MVDDPVQAVLFDLGNTLVAYFRSPDFPPILRESIVGISEFLSQRASAAIDAERAYRLALDLNVEDPEYRVRPLEDRLLEIFGDSAVTRESLPELCSLFLRPVFDLARLDPEALPTLAELRRRGVRTAIVSNTPWGSPSQHWAAEVDRHGLTEAVDAVVFCVDVGWRKPSPRIFQHALARLGVEARDAAFVGDHPRQDIAGAERSGLRAILLDPSGGSAGDATRCISSLGELIPLLDSEAAR